MINKMNIFFSHSSHFVFLKAHPFDDFIFNYLQNNFVPFKKKYINARSTNLIKIKRQAKWLAQHQRVNL